MTIAHHIRRHHAKVLWAIVLALLVGNAGGFVGGYVGHDTLKRFLGGRRDAPSVIKSHWLNLPDQTVRLSGGGTGVVDLSYLLGPVQNQGNTNACGSFSLTSLLYALRLQRGELPPTYFSPWFQRYNTVGNRDGYTTMQDNVLSSDRGGMVYHYMQEHPGTPTADEYRSAKAKSASFHVFSTGGVGTFDRIRYELGQGHPVWLLSQVNDGMWFLKADNPYTDNGGGYHGSHFEVVVGVYGGYLKIRNSWGTGYGQGGYWYESQYGVDHTTLEAAIVTVGSQVVWPARPKVTRKPAVHHKAVKHQAPPGAYVATAASYLRVKPTTNSAHLALVGKGATVYGAGKSTPHWLYVTFRGKHGWKLRSQLRRAPARKKAAPAVMVGGGGGRPLDI